MDLKKIERIGLVAQKITFALEDIYFDEEKRKIFNVIYNRYLLPVDPNTSMDPYDAIVLLGRKNYAEFEQMVKEMKEKNLISDE